jgi:uncharacterized membrane protein YoaK (UPF0700 family)
MLRFSLLLTFIAGFTDATTFVAADKLFSAHVTGNFIVLAYDLLQGADRSAYNKLLTFPVFVAAVMLAARWDGKGRPGPLLRIEGGLLLLAAAMALLLHWVFPAAMIVVAAMGIQNAIGRLYPGYTWAVTTVMTGNVTLAAVSFVQGLAGRPRDAGKLSAGRRILAMIGIFFTGCLCGGFLAARLGLAVVAVPGVLALTAGDRKGK